MYQSTLSLDIHRGHLHRTDSALFVLVVRFGKEVPKSVQWTSHEWRVPVYILGRLGARACYKQVLLVQSHSSICFLLLLVVSFYRFWWQAGLVTRIHWVGWCTPWPLGREEGENILTYATPHFKLLCYLLTKKDIRTVAFLKNIAFEGLLSATWWRSLSWNRLIKKFNLNTSCLHCSAI